VQKQIRRTRVLSRTVISSSILLAFCMPAVAQDNSNTTSATELAPVVVTSTRIEKPISETPASISLVTGEQMRGGGQPQINLSEALNGVPGLLIQNRQNYAQDLQISLRGFGSRSTFGMRGMRMYIDGIPATMPDGQGQSSNVDIASIDRIEVLKGPFSALYGNSSGGVIQVFTAPGEGPLKVGGTVSVGSNNTHRYALEASGATQQATGLTDYRLSVNKFDTDGFRDHSATRKYLANARLGFAFGNDSTLTLTLNSVDIKADDPSGLDAATLAANRTGVMPIINQYNVRKTVKQTQGGATWNKHIDGNNALQLTTYFGTRHTEQYLPIPFGAQANANHGGGVIDLQREYAGFDARWTNQSTLGGRPLTVVGGLAYDWLGEDRKGYENFVGTGANRPVGIKGNLRRDERNTAWNLDPYVQASWDFADRWSWDVGLRFSSLFLESKDYYLSNKDDSGSVSYHQLLPVTAIRYAVNDDVNVYASLGRGFETPTFNEISYSSTDGTITGLNFGLRPSVNTNLELGVKAKTALGNINAAVFQTWTRDEIMAKNTAFGRTVYENLGNTKRQGVELAWDKSFAGSGVAQVAYTWIDAKVNSTDAGIPGIAKNMLFTSVAWRPKQGWQAGADWRFMDTVAATTNNVAYAPAYSTAAIYTGYKFDWDKWQFGAFARVDNLFDREYVGSVILNDANGRYYEPAPGRNWTLSVSANYSF
jgi:iron complex outermembrane receptor protein